MTLDQALLIGLVSATVAGLVITWLVHRTRAKWRQRDLLREFIGKWAEQVTVPTEVEAVRLEFSERRLPLEHDGRFPLAFKVASRKLQNKYEKFIKLRSTFITTCHDLFNHIKQECADKTGIPVTDWGDSRNWPESVLLPTFVLSIYEQVININRKAFSLEDASYNIASFSQTGQGFERKGLRLTVTYGDGGGPELAQAGDKETLENVRVVHRHMMEEDYCQKFAADVEHICYLRQEAVTMAGKVGEALLRLQVS